MTTLLNRIGLLLCCLVLCYWPIERSRAQTNSVLQLEPFLTGLAAPVFITSAHDQTNRLFILEQAGRIRVRQPGATTAAVFLDITAKVLSGGERGLLGLAFHPQFSSNRRFFVNYTRQTDGATVIAEYKASASNPNMADTAETILLTIPQPFQNHNGGMLDFGPDGFLYIGMGDGGSANDPGNRAQNVEELLGKILRIDVNTPNGATPYSSPSSNPFFGPTPGRDEIYAVGMRNPWRFSFDRLTGELYAGDVGQDAREEIDLIKLGGNYGWRVLEGTRCTNLGPGSCTDAKFTPPLYDYPHVGSNCAGSVTGGYVYRGAALTLTPGAYLFGDYCFGTLYLRENGAVRTLFDTNLGITSFGEDEAGELYVVAGAGTIYRLVNAAPRALVNVSAASYRGASLAPESIVAAFGTGLATGTQSAATTPLPTAMLETRVSVRDATGVERLAPQFFVSPTQVNYQIPAGTALGQARVTITSGQGVVSAQDITIAKVSPAIFALNASGRGLPAAVVLRGQTVEPIARFNPATNQYEAIPIDVGLGSEPVFLVVFGTGFRFSGALSSATATIGGTNAPVTFAGAQGSLIGVDQANLSIPRSLIGRGDVDVVLTVDGQVANTVRVNIR
ncbi:MAG: PQQ-dependent sugar dehydrogenase [Acidobacteria bacterium]|nr:PQQ-dependent sugar dehydrogenase [Acidobacteriota bacterium]MBI3426709.1 PQQ-dependent sugar dehydrogenase [Acidobacteriota bacterium]